LDTLEEGDIVVSSIIGDWIGLKILTHKIKKSPLLGGDLEGAYV